MRDVCAGQQHGMASWGVGGERVMRACGSAGRESEASVWGATTVKGRGRDEHAEINYNYHSMSCRTEVGWSSGRGRGCGGLDMENNEERTTDGSGL